jgi:hypothetical protein
MPDPVPDFLAILQELARPQVDFIVIGGVGAVLQGAPLATFDLDLVYSRQPGNLDRLVSALQALDAYYREQAARRVTPSVSLLAGPGHHLLMTRAGPLDLLGAVSGGRAYEDLLAHTVEMEITSELRVKVLDLAMLITLKEEMGREKDLAVLPVLRRTLRERDQ